MASQFLLKPIWWVPYNYASSYANTCIIRFCHVYNVDVVCFLQFNISMVFANTNLYVQSYRIVRLWQYKATKEFIGHVNVLDTASNVRLLQHNAVWAFWHLPRLKSWDSRVAVARLITMPHTRQRVMRFLTNSYGCSCQWASSHEGWPTYFSAFPAF